MGHIQRRHLTGARVGLLLSSVMSVGTEVIGRILERRVTNALRARDLGQLRDTLLPRLLSGKLLIEEAREAVEAAA